MEERFQATEKKFERQTRSMEHVSRPAKSMARFPIQAIQHKILIRFINTANTKTNLPMVSTT